MKIRKAKVQDVGQLALLWKELMLHHLRLCRKGTAGYEMHRTAPDAERVWRAWIRKHIRSRNSLVIVAESDSRIVGYSLSFIKKNVPVYRIKRLGYMSDLCVTKPYRSRGIGTSFHKEVFAWFRKKKISYASIMYHARNPDAARLYARWGFSPFHAELRCRL